MELISVTPSTFRSILQNVLGMYYENYYKGNYSNVKREIMNDRWFTILGTCMVEKGWGLF